MAKKVAGPGRLGSAKAVKKSLKGGGQKNVRTIPGEDSLTVRFLDEPEDWHGYYEHWLKDGPMPCTTDECDGCESDDDDERRKSFKYLANAYVVDDQKVWALKMPKTLVESLMNFHKKYKGTLRDRDYELSRTGSGQYDTKYMAAPDDKSPMKLSRFDNKKHDLAAVLSAIVNDEDIEDDDEEDEPVRKKSKKGKKSGPRKSREDPWEDDDDEDEPVRKKSKKSSPKKKTTSKKRSATVVRRKK